MVGEIEKKGDCPQAFGLAYDQNAQFRKTMEDTHTLIDSFNGSKKQAFFGIYDGHGGQGAALYAEQSLHQNFIHQLSQTKDVDAAWADTMRVTDDQIKEKDILFSGTTAICCYIDCDNISPGSVGRLHTANVGDARAVLARGGQAVRLSLDHKPSDIEEQTRIKASGGFVQQNRVNGILGVARALGDHLLKEVVISEPYTSTYDLMPDDEFIVLGCDGLWDVMSDAEVVRVCRNELTAKRAQPQMTRAAMAARELLQQALAANTTDNVSIIVVIL